MLPYHTKLMSAVGGGAFEVKAARCPPPNSAMSRGAEFTGIADGTDGILSLWVNFDATMDSSNTTIYSSDPSGGARMILRRLATGVIELKIENTGGGSVIDLSSTTTFDSTSGWVHILAGWNVANGGVLYVNDVQEDTDAHSGADLDYTDGNHFFARDGLSTFYTMELAEIYFNTIDYLNFTSAGNRAKFISVAGKPVDLGDDGSKPTGSQPIMYGSVRDGDVATAIATNRGTGGDLSVSGVMTLAPTSPSD